MKEFKSSINFYKNINKDMFTRTANINVEIHYKEREFKKYDTFEFVKGGYILSIVGDIFDSNIDLYCGGQCKDELEKYIGTLNLNKNTMELFHKLLNYWNEYHLNDLKAGTKKQTEFLKQHDSKNMDYKKSVELLKNNGLYEDNNYKYGYGWLYKEIPNTVIEDIENTCVELKKELKKHYNNYE